MIRSIARFLLLLSLTFGFLLPKMGAVLVEIVPGIHTAVLCTGTELVILTLDANGDPIELPEIKAQHCTLADLADPGTGFIPAWQGLARSFHHPFAVKLHPAPGMDTLAAIWPSRAPPEVT